MASVSHSQAISGAGLSIQSTPVVRTGSGTIGLEEVLPVAQAGTLTTRSDANTGTITMGSGSHTIATGNVVDIYWSGGVQYGVTVGTVSATAVPIDSGIGDDLPATSTDVTVVPQTSINVLVDGDNAAIVAVVLETANKSTRTAGHVQLRDSSNAEIAEIDLVTNVPQVWDIEGGSTNPFTGNVITNGKVSQGGASSTENYTLKLLGVQDASP